MGGPSSSGGGNDNDVSGAEAVATNKLTYSDKKINKNKKPADYDPEKDDTEAKLDLFQNDPYTKDQKGPIGLKFLEGAFDAGAKKTRQFFTDKVLTSERGMKNLGYTKDEFSRLSRTKQEEVYKDYRMSRQAGHTDAYGNLHPDYYKGADGNIISRGKDDYGGVPNAKSEVQPKVASQMDNTGVKSKMITADKTSPTSVEMNLTEDQRMSKVKRQGRKTTMLTDLNESKKPTLSKKVLLG